MKTVVMGRVKRIVAVVPDKLIAHYRFFGEQEAVFITRAQVDVVLVEPRYWPVHPHQRIVLIIFPAAVVISNQCNGVPTGVCDFIKRRTSTIALVISSG